MKRKQRKARPFDSWEPKLPTAAVFVFCALFLLAISNFSFLNRAFTAFLSRSHDVFPPISEMTAAAKIGHILNLFELLGMTLISAGIGAGIERKLRFDQLYPYKNWPVKAGLGFGAMAYAFLFLGLIQALYPIILFLVGFSGILFGLWSLRRESNFLKDALGPVAPNNILMICALIVLAGWGILLSLPYAMIPETYIDALKYHLALPDLYLLNHGITSQPLNIFSGMPSIPQMLYGWTLTVNPNGSLAQILHWSFGIWIALSSIYLCNQLGTGKAGALAAVLFLTAPSVIVAGFHTSDGLEWGFFQLLAFHAYIGAVTEKNEVKRHSWLTLTGTMIGFTLSCKYPAWVLPCGFILANTFLYFWERNSSLTKTEILHIAKISLLILSPWIVRNLFFYGNPIYPYLHEFIRPDSEFQPNWRSLSINAAWDWSHIFTSWKGFVEFIGFLWYFTNPGDLGKSIGPIILGLSPILFLTKIPTKPKILLLLELGGLIPLLLIARYPRYYVAHLAPFFILFSIYICSLKEKAIRNLFFMIIIIPIVLCLLVIDSKHPRKNNWPAFLGKVSRSEFLGHSRHEYPNPPFAGYEFLNKVAAKDAKVLVLGDERGFYLRRKYFLSTWREQSLFERWAEESSNPEDFKQKFIDNKIQYILINTAFMSWSLQEIALTPRAKEIADAFLANYLKRIFEVADPHDRRVIVYQIK